MAWTASYYEELRGRVRAVLIAVEAQLPSTTVDLVSEMIDANEPGVALETISEMLVESQGIISADILTLVRELVETMGLNRINVERLRPLVLPKEGPWES
jgi:hypothetical protein